MRPFVFAVLAGAIVAGGAWGQGLSDAQQRARDCAAIFYAGSEELRRKGRIDSATAKLVQSQALRFADALPGNRRQRTEVVNARIRELSRGRSSEQLLLDFNSRRQACEDEFF